MVAPHFETQLTRSLVRIPNSGRDRRAGSLLHDLSRMSPAAALVPIANYIALGLRTTTMLPQTPPTSFMDARSGKLQGRVVPELTSRGASAVGVPSQVGTTTPVSFPLHTNETLSTPTEVIVSSPDYPSATSSPPHSASRPVVKSELTRKRSLPAVLQNSSPVTTVENKSPKVPRTATTTTITTTKTTRQARRRRARDTPTMQQLLRERNELVAENQALKQQLARQYQQQQHASMVEPVV